MILSWDAGSTSGLIAPPRRQNCLNTCAEKAAAGFFWTGGSPPGRLLLEVFHTCPTGRRLWRDPECWSNCISRQTWARLRINPSGRTVGFGWGERRLNYVDLKWWKEVRWMLLFYISQSKASEMYWFDISIETAISAHVANISQWYPALAGRMFVRLYWTNGPDLVFSGGEVDQYLDNLAELFTCLSSLLRLKSQNKSAKSGLFFKRQLKKPRWITLDGI